MADKWISNEFVIGYSRLDAIAKALPKETNKLVQEAATGLRGEIIIRIKQGSKSGRMYKRGNKYHQASAAGESPADDTGHLASTVKKKKLGQSKAAVYVSSENAEVLEFGGVRMKKRPFVRPAYKKIKLQFLRELLKMESRIRWAQ